MYSTHNESKLIAAGRFTKKSLKAIKRDSH